MNSQQQITNTEMVDELSKWGVGLGILVVALAPLSIPILVLTAVALVPLLVPLVAIGLVALVVGGPLVLGRRVVRRMRRRPRDFAPDPRPPTSRPAAHHP
jgi:hypothetical protein